jgi:hypothetical protein
MCCGTAGDKHHYSKQVALRATCRTVAGFRAELATLLRIEIEAGALGQVRPMPSRQFIGRRYEVCAFPPGYAAAREDHFDEEGAEQG